MSNYWSLHCQTCSVYSETNINHGDDILRSMVATYPHIRAAQEADKIGYLEVSVMAYGGELFSFLAEHHTHILDLADEYGRYEPLESGTIIDDKQQISYQGAFETVIQMVEESDASTSVSALWEIVTDVAETTPYVYNDNNGMMECLFCNDSYGWGKVKHTQDHEPECTYRRAVELVRGRRKE